MYFVNVINKTNNICVDRSYTKTVKKYRLYILFSCYSRAVTALSVALVISIVDSIQIELRKRSSTYSDSRFQNGLIAELDNR